MNTFVGLILLLVYSFAMLVAPVAWVCTLVFMVKTIANRKPHVRLWRDAPFCNPWNIMLNSSLLTDEGLRCRRVVVKSAGWFVIPILLLLALAAATGNFN